MSIFALPIPSGLRPSPLDKGSRPPVPHYGGCVTERLCNISGAQNLNGWSQFPPGHWALGLRKLPPLRFIFCAWLCRANASGLFSSVGAAPCGRPPQRSRRLYGTASGMRYSVCERAAQCAAPTRIRKRLRVCRPPPHDLSTAATKALSNRGVPSVRLLPSERQRKTRNRQSAEPPTPLRQPPRPPNWGPA